MPGELRSANSKAFLNSSTTSVCRESLPPAPCFLANCIMVIRVRMKIRTYNIITCKKDNLPLKAMD